MVTKQKRRGQMPRSKQARLPERGLRTRAFEVVRGTEGWGQGELSHGVPLISQTQSSFSQAWLLQSTLISKSYFKNTRAVRKNSQPLSASKENRLQLDTFLTVV